MIKITIGKYGQLTRVFLNDRFIYDSALTQKAEYNHLMALFDNLQKLDMPIITIDPTTLEITIA